MEYVYDSGVWYLQDYIHLNDKNQLRIILPSFNNDDLNLLLRGYSLIEDYEFCCEIEKYKNK